MKNRLIQSTYQNNLDPFIKCLTARLRQIQHVQIPTFCMLQRELLKEKESKKKQIRPNKSQPLDETVLPTDKLSLNQIVNIWHILYAFSIVYYSM